jgi:hypothetical protein
MTRGIAPAQRHRAPKPVPTRDPQHQFQAKQIRRRLAVAREVSQRRFPAPLGLQRTVAKQREPPVGGRGPRPQGGRGQVREPCLGRPWPRPDHPDRGPLGQLRGPTGPAPLQRPLARRTQQGAPQPAKDQKVLGVGTTARSLAWVEDLRYRAGEACATPQGSRSALLWEVGDIQKHRSDCFSSRFYGLHLLRRPLTRHF